MSCLALSLTLVSAFVPVSPVAGEQASLAAAPVFAQVEPTAPPPPAAPPAQAAPPTAYAAPPPVAGGEAPHLKGPSVFGILAYGGYGAGARFAIPIPGSLIQHPTIRDGFAIEFGGDFVHWSESYVGGYDWSYTVVRIAAGVMWDIWLTPQFALYPKIELGYNHYSYNYGGLSISEDYSPIFFNGAGGALYRMNNGLTLRAEVGYTGLALGIGWLF